jgi:penicillin amidase
MGSARTLLRLLGKRLPVTSGDVDVDGLDGGIEIRRDRFGVPHAYATTDRDAWFALGFCQGQDRAFQLEVHQRLVRGTLAALIGSEALPIDRLNRRLGLARYGRDALAGLDDAHRELAIAYASGATAGRTVGQPRRPHEYVLLRSRPGPYEASDALGLLALQSFLLASNWDVELARLMIVSLDGPEAAAALDPTYPHWQPATVQVGMPAGSAVAVIEALSRDLGALAAVTGIGGGSNNWALSAARTATGRPILANDPHLAPLLPAHWYLAHLETPEWAVAGASLPGAPALAAGHNGHAAWGITAGLIDNTDLFIEEVDGTSVRRGDGFEPCDVIGEVIEVRGGDPEHIDVLVTDRGPIISPALDGDLPALSLAATWLRPNRAAGAMFDLGRVRSFHDLRAAFRGWSGLSLNVVYADASGTIGWQLIGTAPLRRSGSGAAPLPAWDPAVGWLPDTVPFADMPHAVDPPEGRVATANNHPGTGWPFLGHDFLDGYRLARIDESLAARDDWDVPGCLALQTDRLSLPWREISAAVLAAAERAGDLGDAVDVLRAWDGVLSPGSPAATVFEYFLAELARLVAVAKAPRAAGWALGTGFTPLVPFTSFLVRRTSHLIRLLRERPEGWFADGWDEAIRAALRAAVERLAADHGRDPRRWAWGEVRRLTLRHPLGSRPPLGEIFDLGPIPHGGDANTVNPAPVDPADPTGNPDFAIASLRMVIDVGDWELSRFVLPGGQSGNPFSRHYADQLQLWQRGDAFPIVWSRRAVEQATRTTLRLLSKG